MLEEIRLHQVVEDVVLTDPLDGAAAGGAQRGALHPARVAGRAKGVHAGLQAEHGDGPSDAPAEHWQVERPPARHSHPVRPSPGMPGHTRCLFPPEEEVALLRLRVRHRTEKQAHPQSPSSRLSGAWSLGGVLPAAGRPASSVSDRDGA